MTRTLHIKTFGCQMNVYDSDRMAGILQKSGFEEEPDLSKADVVLINTCAIRAKSEQKVLSLLGQLRPLKEKNPKKVIGITGCVGQRMGRHLLQRVPHLDLVMGPDGIEKVGEYVEEVVTRRRRLIAADLDQDRNRQYSQPAIVKKAKPAEFLTIMKGCDHFCSYCIVPFVRGREKSRPIAEIVEDVEKLAKEGTKEITFLGQNINTYGKGTSENLAALVERTNEIEGIERIRYVTSHPRDLGEDLIQQFGTIEKLCPALHLPFQSGSNAILKQMGRLYSIEEYLSKVEALRAVCPDIALSTDVIVGFPGETDEDFEQTIQVLKDVRFSGGFFFNYSPRPGTKAFPLGDKIPDAVKSERLARVHQTVFEWVLKENQALLGKRIRCLVEAKDKKGRFFMGRTTHNKVVHILNAGPSCVGKMIDVEISEANGSNMKGYYVDAPRTNRSKSA